jgi:hypothetical protein
MSYTQDQDVVPAALPRREPYDRRQDTIETVRKLPRIARLLEID